MNYSNSSNEEWTISENKQFENALGELDLSSPNLFENMKAIMPWKTVEQIKSHYEKLFEDVLVTEGGEFESDNADGDVVDSGDLIQLKGVPWTEEEHRSFLMGLKELGKGEWKNISRDYVPTKTTSQVACHAQKYFRRQKCSTPLQKRRYSIHDIRIFNSAIIDTSTKKPPRRTLRCETWPPYQPLHPPPTPTHNLVDHNNSLIAQQYYNPSSSAYQQAAPNSIIIDNNNNNNSNSNSNNNNNYNNNSYYNYNYNYCYYSNNNNIINNNNNNNNNNNGDNNNNTASTNLNGGSSSSSTSYLEMIMGSSSNNNNNNDNYNNIDDAYNMGYDDQYSNYDDLLAAAAVPSYWFPPSPNHDMPFY